MKKLIILLILVSSCQNSCQHRYDSICIQDNTENTYDKLYDRIQSQRKYIRSQWSDLDIFKMAELIEFASSETNESQDNLIALMEAESNFNRKAYARNYDHKTISVPIYFDGELISLIHRRVKYVKSIDRGIWQLNSEYTPERATKKLNRKIRNSDYYDLENSTLLMIQARKECGKFSDVWFAVCYNHPKSARNGIMTEYGKRWLELRNSIMRIEHLAVNI